MSTVIHVSQVHYPESDGKPMGETDLHREAMVRHIQILQDFYEGQQVYVSGDLLVYYVQGNPKKYVVPDAFVVKGIAPRERRIYKIWVEGRAPDVIIETTSRKTRRKDTVGKPALYARLGVAEYFLFDPDQEYLDPPLQGYRLVGETYEEIQPEEAGSLKSQELRLALRIEQGGLQFYRLDTGERLLTPRERAAQQAERAQQQAERAQQQAERAQQQAERAEREAEAHRSAEAELARLRAELAQRSRG
jgi:Uma2 family endonuclease